MVNSVLVSIYNYKLTKLKLTILRNYNLKNMYSNKRCTKEENVKKSLPTIN